jgi:tRNA nucleotidyltransferase/poly(A) polymerase
MKFIYKPKNKLEKFGVKVYSALVENFPQTFFVGGMVRDLLQKKDIVDVDVATSALPEQIITALKKCRIPYDDSYKQFGNIIAKQRNKAVEITTLRKDLKSADRFPKVMYISSPKIDSKRRDFSVNALYLKPKTSELLDFTRGLADIKKRQIKFIGNPAERIKQDPLRIIRALRFALSLNFQLERKTKLAIKNNFKLISYLTKTKLQKEILKIKTPQKRKILEEVINNPKLLDKYFK